MTPGQMVRTRRRARDWTQADLSYVLAKPVQWVSEVENGKKAITADAALKLEAAFDVPAVDWLYAQADQEPGPSPVDHHVTVGTRRNKVPPDTH